MNRKDWQIQSTIEKENLNIVWDVVIIGAGPAGALAACGLAESDNKILLIDKARFPRSKVCGCCLNGAAEDVLARAGLSDIFAQAGSSSLTTLQLRDGIQQSVVNLPGGHALSREFMDAYLVREAIKRGAEFLSGASAKVSVALPNDYMQIEINGATISSSVKTKLVLVADGLGGHALSHWPEFATIVEPKARFGCGTILGGNHDFDRGCIYMCCHHSGYAGLVVLEDGRIDIAAALDRDYCRKIGGPGKAVAEIFNSCRLPLPAGLSDSVWHGTDSLTQRRSCVAAERIFVIGDSCGYAEPFTGEGMAWAFQSAEAVMPFAQKAIDGWHSDLVDQWQKHLTQLLAARQRRSSLIAHSLRSDFVRTLAFPLISTFPQLADKFISGIGQSVSTGNDASNMAWHR